MIGLRLVSGNNLVDAGTVVTLHLVLQFSKSSLAARNIGRCSVRCSAK